MANDERDDEEVIEPLPTDETEEELERIRRSNDLDQQMEREGITSRHNRGYDDAVRGVPKRTWSSEAYVVSGISRTLRTARYGGG